MATTLTAANATNGMTLTPDNTGILAVKTGSGSGTTALTLDASQNATFAGTLAVAGSTTALYPLVSGTAQSAPFANTSSINFTGIPSSATRITVSIVALSYVGAGVGTLQIGSGTLTTTGYASNHVSLVNSATVAASSTTNGFGILNTGVSTSNITGIYTLTLATGNTWCFSEQVFRVGDATMTLANGFITLSGVLDRLSVVATTSTFDAGTVNIMWE